MRSFMMHTADTNSVYHIKKTGIGGARSTSAGEGDAYRIVVGKPEGKRPLRRP